MLLKTKNILIKKGVFMTFLILITFVIIFLLLYSACIVSSKCSRKEELQEIEVIVKDLESHNE